MVLTVSLQASRGGTAIAGCLAAAFLTLCTLRAPLLSVARTDYSINTSSKRTSTAASVQTLDNGIPPQAQMARHWLEEAGRPGKEGVRTRRDAAEKAELQPARPLLLLHVGKGGGGTVSEEFARRSIPLVKCHPRPCPEKLGGFAYTVIVLRDPVDRFVSAFNWRHLLMCRPHNETRRRGKGAAGADPAEFCIDPGPEGMLHTVYGGDPSALAERVCDGGEEGSRARSHVGLIGHLRDPLTAWLPAAHLGGAPGVIALVTEPGFDLQAQVDAVLGHWRAAEHVAEKKRKGVHLAVNRHSSRNGSRVRSLTPLASCCLARYYRGDYELLGKLGQVACAFGRPDLCEGALASILRRRGRFLESGGSCEEVARR